MCYENVHFVDERVCSLSWISITMLILWLMSTNFDRLILTHGWLRLILFWSSYESWWILQNHGEPSWFCRNCASEFQQNHSVTVILSNPPRFQTCTIVTFEWTRLAPPAYAQWIPYSHTILKMMQAFKVEWEWCIIYIQSWFKCSFVNRESQKIVACSKFSIQ